MSVSNQPRLDASACSLSVRSNSPGTGIIVDGFAGQGICSPGVRNSSKNGWQHAASGSGRAVGLYWSIKESISRVSLDTLRPLRMRLPIGLAFVVGIALSLEAADCPIMSAYCDGL